MSLTTFGKLLEMQVLGIHLTPSESVILGVRPSNLCITKLVLPSDSDGSSSLRIIAIEHARAERYLRDPMLKSLTIEMKTLRFQKVT